MASSNDTVNANLTMLISVVSSSTASKNINAISQSLNERGTNHLYLTYKYLKLTNKMCEAIQSGLHDYESLRYRPFMLAIMAILRDPSREIEVGNIVNLLQRVHKHNSKYFLEAELITQWMVRVIPFLFSFLSAAASSSYNLNKELISLKRLYPGCRRRQGQVPSI